MSGVILAFPMPVVVYGGTVCVMGNKARGFQVAHESSSGDSWGSITEYATGQEAIAAAYALNRDTYLGGCNVEICQAALDDREGVTRLDQSGGEDF